MKLRVQQLEISNVFLERDNVTKQRILEQVGKGRFQEIASYSLRKKDEIMKLQHQVNELQEKEKELTAENRVLKEGSSIFHLRKRIEDQGTENKKLRNLVQNLRRERDYNTELHVKKLEEQSNKSEEAMKDLRSKNEQYNKKLHDRIKSLTDEVVVLSEKVMDKHKGTVNIVDELQVTMLHSLRNKSEIIFNTVSYEGHFQSSKSTTTMFIGIE